MQREIHTRSEKEDIADGWSKSQRIFWGSDAGVRRCRGPELHSLVKEATGR